MPTEEREARAWTLAEVEAAVRGAWSAETADHPEAWDASSPAACQCGVTSLLVRELLGGDILLADVLDGDEIVARHAWNRLPSGAEVDLTAEQFSGGVKFGPSQTGEPRVREARPDAYDTLRNRVLDRLGA